MISSTLGCEVRQELYLANQYEKARQDVGLFLSAINVSFHFSFRILGSKVGNTLKNCLAETIYLQIHDLFDAVIGLRFRKCNRNN